MKMANKTGTSILKGLNSPCFPWENLKPRRECVGEAANTAGLEAKHLQTNSTPH